jgi:hypothetical protein
MVGQTTFVTPLKRLLLGPISDKKSVKSSHLHHQKPQIRPLSTSPGDKPSGWIDNFKLWKFPMGMGLVIKGFKNKRPNGIPQFIIQNLEFKIGWLVN